MPRPSPRAPETGERAEALALFAVALRPPTDVQALKKCLGGLQERLQGNAASEVAEASSRLAEEAWPEREYHRLFLGPVRPAAPPFESVYREGIAFGSSARTFLEEMRAMGVEPVEEFRLPPDHVAIQLEYLANLEHRAERAKAEGNLEEFLLWSERSRSFVEEHLARWLPAFLTRLEEKAPWSPYTGLVRAALEFLRLPRDAAPEDP